MSLMNVNIGEIQGRDGSFYLLEVDIKKGNPMRQHPQLNSIWEDDLNVIAIEAIDMIIEHTRVFPRYDFGKILLVMHANGHKNEVVGITGYLPWDNKNYVGLRWHGLLPAYRGDGLSLLVLDKVRSLAKSAYPEARKLVEFMPVSEDPKHVEIKSYFTSLGFEPLYGEVNVDWSPHKWQEFSVDINKSFLDMNTKSKVRPS